MTTFKSISCQRVHFEIFHGCITSMSLYSEVNWKSYCTHFLYCLAHQSWLDFTALCQPLRCGTLSLLYWYESKWRDVYLSLWLTIYSPNLPNYWIRARLRFINFTKLNWTVWKKRFYIYFKFLMLCRTSTLYSCFPMVRVLGYIHILSNILAWIQVFNWDQFKSFHYFFSFCTKTTKFPINQLINIGMYQK